MFNNAPEGSVVVIENRNRPMLVKFADGSVASSDTWLVGTLTALGFSPVSDTPERHGARQWWTFQPSYSESVTGIGREYYAPNVAGFAGVNLVRRSVECARGFVAIAKGSSINNNYEKGRK